jgi:hypothetical protein
MSQSEVTEGLPRSSGLATMTQGDDLLYRGQGCQIYPPISFRRRHMYHDDEQNRL